MTATVVSEVRYQSYVRRQYKITLTDSAGVDHDYMSDFVNVDETDDGSNAKVEQLANVKAQEILHWINEMNSLRDPAHIDMGGWYEHTVPLWNTWEEACYPAVTHWLQKKYMQDILYCDLTCSRLTNGEMADIAGQPNDVRAEQQIATNAQIVLDEYVSLIDKNGNPRA